MSDLGADESAGWATRSLSSSISRAIIAAIAGWQVIMLWALLISGNPGGLRVALVVAHLGLFFLALEARADKLAPAVLVFLLYVVTVADWAVAEDYNSALSLAGCWSVNLASASAALLARGRLAIALPAVAAVTLPPALYAVNPDWGPDLPIGIVITQLSILIVSRLGVQPLLAFAALVDEQAARVETETQRAASDRAARHAAAEDARVLHDTVINTLGAIANGAASRFDSELVRQRCARDAETAEALRAGLESVAHGEGLRAVLDRPGSLVRRTGLSDAELDGVEAQLPDDVIRKLALAVGELVQNAHKHAQATQIIADLQEVNGSFVVTIHDDGIGFDPQTVEGTGLKESVFSRLLDAGVAVTVDTAPGQGTTAILARTLVPRPLPQDLPGESTEQDFGDVVDELRRRAAWLWAGGLSVVGLILAAFSHPVREEFAMVAVIALVCAVARMSSQSGSQVSGPAVLLLAAGAAAAFVLGAAAVDFGQTDVVLWQVIGPTAPLIVVLATGRTPMAIRASVMLFVIVVGVTTAVEWRDSVGAAATLPVGAAAVLGFVAAWAAFHRAIVAVGERAVHDQREAFELRVEHSISEAAETARLRWREAGLQASVRLLRGVADGDLDVSDDAVRMSCGHEEAYLRQVIQLDPDLTRMGQWLARALSESRSVSGELVVRTGDVDAFDDRTASALGQVLLDAVETMGDEAALTVTLFPTSEGLRMTLVSSRGLDVVGRAWVPTPGSHLTYQSVESQHVLEILVQSPEGALARVG